MGDLAVYLSICQSVYPSVCLSISHLPIFIEKKEINYDELSHTFMEAEKTHDLLSADCKPTKASGVNPSLKAGENEMRCSSSTVRSKKKWQISPSAFWYGQGLNR